MKVIVEEKKEKVEKFTMGTLYKGEYGSIVLCTATCEDLIGVTIISNEKFPGKTSEHWNSDSFTKFHGKITLEQE